MRLGWWLAAGAILAAVGCDDLSFGRGAGTACQRDADCDPGLFCDAEVLACRPQQRDGAPCSDGRRCTSGFCRDAVCCNGPCNAECLTCNQAGTVGQCVQAEVGTDPRGDCAETARCAAAVPLCQGSPVWLTSLGGLGDDDVVDLALGGPPDARRLFALMRFRGQVEVAGTTLTSVGDTTDFMVVALDLQGRELWVRAFAGTGLSTPTAVAAGDDDVFVVGTYTGEFDGITSATLSPDGFVLALEPASGELRFRRDLQGAGTQQLDDVASLAGRAVVVGRIDGDAELQPTLVPIAHLGTAADAIWLSLSPVDGSLIGRGSVHDPAGVQTVQGATAVAAQLAGSTERVAIAVGGEGDVEIAADGASHAVSLGSPSNSLVFLLEGSAGAPLGFRSNLLPIEGEGAQTIGALALTSTSVWGAGTMTDDIDAPGLVSHDRALDGFLFRAGLADSAPVLRAVRGAFDVGLTTLAAHPQLDFALIAGGFEVEAQYDVATPINARGARDAFAIELDGESLDQRWGVPLGGLLDDGIRAAVVDEDGSLYVAGRYRHDFSPLGPVAVGGTDVFVARLAR